MLLRRVLQASRRRFSTTEAIQSPATSPLLHHQSLANGVPIKTRLAWFSLGLNCTLVLALYQLGQDASDAAGKLDDDLKKLRDDTAVVQKGLRAKVAKLEADLGKLKSEQQAPNKA